MNYAQRSDQCQNPVGKKLLHLMQHKQTNLAISADVTKSKELLDLANTLGPEICVLKTHIDIIEDFTSELTHQLRELADKHQFILFEDRKFADIGNTVKLQYEKGIYRIADWADIINAHTLPGPGIIDGLKSIGLPKQRSMLLLAEMSSAQNLFTESYTNQTLALAEQHRDFVIGFIAQRKLSSDPNWIHFTPGIQLEGKHDTLGQQYITPEQAIRKNGSDIIIVGRGILNAKNPLATAKQYRAVAWDATKP